MSAEEYAEAAKAIPCEVHMISGCRDEQTSADGACVPRNCQVYYRSTTVVS